MKYVTRFRSVEAVQLVDAMWENLDDAPEWLLTACRFQTPPSVEFSTDYFGKRRVLVLMSERGYPVRKTSLFPGDYLVRGGNGAILPCRKVEFEEQYEKTDDFSLPYLYRPAM